MKTKVVVKERDTYCVITIDTPFGEQYRIEISDNEDGMSITTAEKSLVVQPKVVNRIVVSTLSNP